MPFDNIKRMGMLGRRKEELDEAMKASPGGDTRQPRPSKEPEPGSEEYLRRRQREAEQDLRNAPRRGR